MTYVLFWLPFLLLGVVVGLVYLSYARWRRKRLWWLTLCGALLVLCVMFSRPFDIARGDRWAILAREHPWYRAAPDDFDTPNFRKLADSKVFSVTKSKQAQAVEKLKLTPILKISSATATDLTGRQVQLHPGEAPYLVRGIDTYNVDGGRNHHVFVGNKQLLVINSVLGLTARQTRYHPLVVILKSQPSEVFIDFNSAF